jgi:integral membrane sensor domain MASE1
MSLDASGQALSPSFGGCGGRYLGRVAALAALYFIVGKLALLLVIPPGYATPVWPAAGIALAALLLFGYRLWPGVVLGSFLINFGTAFEASGTDLILKPLVLASSIGLGAALQAVVGTLLVRRYAGFPNTFTKVNEITKLLAFGGPISCMISATAGTTSLVIGDEISWTEYWFSWCTWWVGDTIGVLIVTPLVLLWIGEPRQVWRGRCIAVVAPVCVALVTVAALFCSYMCTAGNKNVSSLNSSSRRSLSPMS